MMFLAIGISKEVVKISVLRCGVYFYQKNRLSKVPKIVKKVAQRLTNLTGLSASPLLLWIRFN